ncbi:MAG: bifunctional glutamate N-acetyltransferase/amino-acid acetyltransferase ArgJ [Planctomycetota bacterium]|jgi:glutamate N-acetyltransferase/amino-acid N-acetyltransferase|nr:bifunctional glutamate N-acetyltransferase/amino-acid acetyltransferase ArgJ [Planctomycetota bacterium]
MEEKTRRLEEVPGFRTAAIEAGIREWPKPRNDLALIAAESAVPTAGVFTRNQVAAAPVKLDRRHLKATGGMARAILVNAGVANACTGEGGEDDALGCARRLGAGIDVPEEQILVASTGVIGTRLSLAKMEKGIDLALASLGKTDPGDFARAILTTDLSPKEASAELDGDAGVFIAGACKGSGMIAPNMATMLAFVLTNAAVAPKALAAALKEVVASTFNLVTVDGDTSTNDSLFLMASGVTGVPAVVKDSGRRYDKFVKCLYRVCHSLSAQIARDGEGASKLVRVRVIGARRAREARAAAKTIAESPLVKTAMFGNDPNWGRIVCALGRSSARVDEGRVSLSLCGARLFEKGMPVDFNKADISNAMKTEDIELEVDLGLGKGEATVLTCDLTDGYIRINADYTT